MPYTAPYSSEDTLDRYLFWGLLISIFVHIVLAFLLTNRATRPPPTAIMVDFVSLPPGAITATPPERQIVSTPDRSEEPPPPPNTKLLAERDFATKKEQIKRGDAPDAGKAIAKKGSQAEIGAKPAQ